MGYRQKKFVEPNLLVKPIPFKTNSRLQVTTNTRHIDNRELLITIEVYTAQRPRYKMQEFIVYSGQTVAELRDAMYCTLDHIDDDNADDTDSETSDNLPKPKPNNSETQRHSCMLFVEGQFIIDSRHQTALDYSLPIRQWYTSLLDSPNGHQLKFSRPILDTSSSLLMHETRWRDLSLRIDYPYPLIHQGNCQHTVSIKCMEPFDRHRHPIDASVYPLQVFQCMPSRLACELCSTPGVPGKCAQWAVVGCAKSARLPFTVYCQQCHECVDTEATEVTEVTEGQVTEGQVTREKAFKIVSHIPTLLL